MLVYKKYHLKFLISFVLFVFFTIKPYYILAKNNNKNKLNSQFICFLSKLKNCYFVIQIKNQ